MSALTTDMIAQPDLWRLMILLSHRRLDVALLPPVENETAIYRSFLLDPEADTPVKALEDVFYANPLLLNDFRSVICLVDTPSAMAVPTEVAPADYDLLMSTAFPLDNEAAAVSVSPTGTDTAVMLMSINPDMRGFLSRTYYNIRYYNNLAWLCAHLSPESRNVATPMVYALTRHGSVDLIALQQGRLLAANTFEYDKPIDAAYYVMATRSILRIDPVSPVITAGDDQTALDRRLAEAGTVSRPMQLPALKFKLTAEGAAMPLQLTVTPQNIIK